MLFLFSLFFSFSTAKFLYWLEYANYTVHETIFATGNTALWRTQIGNETNTVMVFNDTLRTPGYVTSDPVSGFVYFTERKTLAFDGRILRWPSWNDSALGVDVVLSDDTSDPVGIKLDLVDVPGWMYFANLASADNSTEIQRLDTGLAAQRTVSNFGQDWRVVDVAMDLTSGQEAIYFSIVNVTGIGGQIWKCPLGGCDDSNPPIVLWNSTNDYLPGALALDVVPLAIIPNGTQLNNGTEYNVSSESGYDLFGVEETTNELTGLEGEEKPVRNTPPTAQSSTRLYFVVNDGITSGKYSVIYRMYTNGTNATIIVPNDYTTTHLLKTCIAVDAQDGYLYWGTSKTGITKGVYIYRSALSGNFTTAERETVYSLTSGSKIMALTVNAIDVQYTYDSSSSGWAWYIITGIVVGSVCAASLCLMALTDVVKMCKHAVAGDSLGGVSSGVGTEQQQQRDIVVAEDDHEEDRERYAEDDGTPAEEVPYHSINNREY